MKKLFIIAILLTGCATAPKVCQVVQPETKYEQALVASKISYQQFIVTNGSSQIRIIKVGELYINPSNRKSSKDWKIWGKSLKEIK